MTLAEVAITRGLRADEVGRRALYHEMCPNCGGIIPDVRLSAGLPCTRCLPEVSESLRMEREPARKVKLVSDALKRDGKLINYRKFSRIISKLDKFNTFFKKHLGYDLWAIQRTWASRVLRGQSFAVVAPTGTGKTVFGLIYALYHVHKIRKTRRTLGDKVYMVLPSSFLVRQALEKLIAFSSNLRVKPRIIAYTGDERREEFIEKLDGGEFDILLTTNQYLSRNFEHISKHKYGFIFVDDVDAILRTSRNIDRILKLIGFEDEDIDRAYELIRTRREYARALARRERDLANELAAKVKTLSRAVRGSRRKVRGILLLSSATTRPRGIRVRLFRELLGFEVGRQSETLRNVADAFAIPDGSLEESVVEYVQKLGGGGLIFVPLDRGTVYAKRLCEFLRENGVRAASTASRSRALIDDFRSGKYDVLVGVASYYGKLVRGLDLPVRIRYTLFAGVPRFKYNLQERTYNPIQLIRMLMELRRVLPAKEARPIDHVLNMLMGYVRMLSWPRIKHMIEEVRSGTEQLRGFARVLVEASDIVARFYSDRAVLDKISREGRVVIAEEEDGRKHISLPDILTYIQASGRASRLFAGGISRGLSLIIVDDERLMDALVRQSQVQFEGLEWKDVDRLDVEAILGEIDRDRNFIAELQQGRIPPDFTSPMRSALLLVESPTKARTIASFFGRPATRRVGDVLNVYEVTTGRLLLGVAATKGHIVDVVTGGIQDLTDIGRDYHGILVIDSSRFIPVYAPLKRCLKCGETFASKENKCPRCGSKRVVTSKSVIDSILEIAPEYDMVLLGTDPDSEGEKISWDLYNLVQGLVRDVKRVEFHEVTRWALEKALESPRPVNEKLVEAQLIRRIEDRWIGFELSERLRKALWDQFKDRFGLSAGRVQTPVLGWIIGRFEEWKRSWRNMLVVRLEGDLILIISEEEGDLEEVEEAIKAGRVKVLTVNLEEREQNPPPPFTTDSLLVGATRYLNASVDQVMRLAQDLFEAGLITYHRTDSTYVSDKGLGVAKEYIMRKVGRGYYRPRKWGSPGAHECIRPTRPLDPTDISEALRFSPVTARLTDKHLRLYSLIFKEFIASQMAPAKIVWQRAVLELGPVRKVVEGPVEYIEKGYASMAPGRVKMLKRLMKGSLTVSSVDKKYTPATSLYRQGDIIALMKKKEIGRPSTYAKIARTLIDRRYVFVKPGGRLAPSKKGIAVYNYLSTKFSSVISEERTRNLEEKMDKVERGEADYQGLLRELYQEISSLPS